MVSSGAGADLGLTTGLEISAPNVTFLSHMADFLDFDILSTLTLGGTLTATGPGGVQFADGNDFDVILIDGSDEAEVVADVLDIEQLQRIVVPDKPLELRPVEDDAAITLVIRRRRGSISTVRTSPSSRCRKSSSAARPGAHSIAVGNDDGSTLEVTQPLTVRAPVGRRAHGSISGGTLDGVSVVLEGPGDGTTLNASTVSMSGDVEIRDGVTVDGAQPRSRRPMVRFGLKVPSTGRARQTMSSSSRPRAEQ